MKNLIKSLKIDFWHEIQAIDFFGKNIQFQHSVCKEAQQVINTEILSQSVRKL